MVPIIFLLTIPFSWGYKTRIFHINKIYIVGIRLFMFNVYMNSNNEINSIKLNKYSSNNPFD